jgi:NarL family two-component system sensor histidine kinase LiaS
LRWRFALSYMLVTACSVALVPITYSLASYVFVIRSPGLPRYLASALEPYAAQALPYLVEVPPDREGLRAWLVDFNSNGRVQGANGFADLWMSGPPHGTSVLTVVDAAGQVVASSAPPATVAPGALLSQQLAPAGQDVLRAALADDNASADLATPTVDGRATIAVPIALPGRLVGALVLDLDVQGTESGYIPRAVLGILGFILLVMLITGLLGLVFGFIISRGLTRRLDVLASAAQAWSKGDFAAEAHDSSGDELGQLARDLNGMAEQIQMLLATRKELAVVEERNRLALDLHDSVKQQVFAASMQLAAARTLVRRDPDAAETRIAEVQRLVSEAQRELTGLIRELRPVALGNKGLAVALREYAADWSHSTGIASAMRVQGERPAPLEVEQALFRVAQEALANIARHSGATGVEIELSWDSDGLLLTLTDNGSGFDIALAEGKGVGLHSMRERVETLGGALTIRHAVGTAGTSVGASVPHAALPTSTLAEAGVDDIAHHVTGVDGDYT